jgi:hypothetical protein
MKGIEQSFKLGLNSELHCRVKAGQMMKVVISLQTPAYGRHEDTDIVNDQTFGKLEASNDDRSLQEFKRRGKRMMNSYPPPFFSLQKCIV